MKAVRIHAYGSPDVLTYEEAPRPKPGPGEVLVRVSATSVNPFDCAVRAGYMQSYFNYSLPLIPGTDVAGVIEEKGEGVSGLSVGDHVYARAGVYRDGANAEYVLAMAGDVALKPRSLDDAHAAAMPHVTLTAWQALIEMAELSKGQTVLIHGAAGGVGHIAVQLAKSRGARVIGTSSTHLDFLEELGVDQVVDHSRTRFESVVKDVDVVLDLIGSDTQERSWAVLKPGGFLISTIQQPSEKTAAEYNVHPGMIASTPPIGKTLGEVAALVDAGKLKPVVSEVLPIKEIRKAHELIEGRHTRGKVVLQVM